jgi:peptidoglycan/LPS O-acetylase OafA/YrhL
MGGFYFRYRCLKLKRPFILKPAQKLYTSLGPATTVGDLSAYSVMCPNNKMLTYWKLDDRYERLGYRVEYECMSVDEATNFACAKYYSQNISIMDSLIGLQSVDVICPADSVLNGWKAETVDDNIRIVYRCCSFTASVSYSINRIVFTAIVYVFFVFTVGYVNYDVWQSERSKNLALSVAQVVEIVEKASVEEKPKEDFDFEVVIGHIQLVHTGTNFNVQTNTDSGIRETGRNILHAVRTSIVSAFSKFVGSEAYTTKSSDKFEAIGFARYLASVHIVLGHMYQGGSLSSLNGFAMFGYTWVPWFFVVSGYVLAVSEIKRRERMQAPVSAIEYVIRRLEAVYPTYLLGIFVALVTTWVTLGAERLPLATNVVVYFILFHSWVPSILENGFPYLVQCWFLSCLLLYWFGFYRIYDTIHELSDKYVLVTFAICSLAIPVLYQVIHLGLGSWYDKRSYGSINEGVDIGVLVLKYHPFMYFHMFLLGCLLPRVRQQLMSWEKSKIFLPYLCCISYFCLLILFCCGGQHIPGYKLGLRLGLISGFQAVLLIGLCNSEDYVARIFSNPYLVRFGNYSFAQYVFQYIVYQWFNSGTYQSYVDIRYFMLLYITSVCVSSVAAPFSNKKNLLTFVMYCVPLIVAYSMLQPYLSTLTYEIAKNSFQGTGAINLNFKLPPWLIDRSLDFKVQTDGFPSFAIFNPSLELRENKYIFARRDHVESKWFTWYGKSYIINKWNTEIVGANYLKKPRQLQSYIIDIPNFKPCVPEPICNTNGTIVVKVTSGPEDPRIFKFLGQEYLSFFAYDNVITSENNATVTNSEYVGYYGTGSDLCTPTEDGLIGRMYIAKIYRKPVNPCSLGRLIPVYQIGLQFPKNSIVKNWLAFTRDSYLFFIHQISPVFQVMLAQSVTDTAVETSLFSSTVIPDHIKALEVASGSVLQISGISSNIHGSANPLYISTADSFFGGEYFLSFFHVLSSNSSLNYALYAFGFTIWDPFQILYISDRLYLNTSGFHSSTCGGAQPFGFVTGLTIESCYEILRCLVISYGVCDKESRVMQMKLANFQAKFMKPAIYTPT